MFLGQVPAGRVSDEIVHAVDLFPTLAGISRRRRTEGSSDRWVVAVSLNGRFAPTCDISMLFNRLASLRGQDPVRADLCEEPAAQLAGKLLAGNCGRSAAADEAK